MVRQRKNWRFSEAFALVFAALCAVGMVGTKTFTAAPASIHAAVTMLFSSRLDVWAVAANCFRTNPVWGSGPGLNVYNLYMQLLCQFGIIGLSAFLVFLYNLFHRYKIINSMEIKGRMAKGAFLSVTAFLMVSMGESTMGDQFSYYALFLFFLVGEPEIVGSGYGFRLDC